MAQNVDQNTITTERLAPERLQALIKASQAQLVGVNRLLEDR